ncbi:RdRP-domain-containing protein [Lentinus tigrinus ALCF2SS1-7]|uniref:RNA-dependent RNA polymerase n=1 Tax=Lentinus tigrinus ALCF2SS1-6 TaxID=1328759 RepID=A0A5C2S9W7_9APHY|nr:RdRP-domain-containing protein [Lentinus tigrinus ALCF2SS1-6]RPD74783.1 RdRP-domain-containing protein [Lentinus tigrinus ALCF2SS1-7]
MNIELEDLRFSATECDVKRAFAAILHQPPFYEPDAKKARRINFAVHLNKPRNALPNNGTAVLTIPDQQLGERFLRAAVRSGGERIQILGKTVYIKRGQERPPKGLIERLNKTPYVDPDEEADRIRKMDVIRDLRILVDVVQFGVYFRHPRDSRTANRTFSIEHEIRREEAYVGELTYDYNHKLLRIELGDYISENTSDHIVIDIANIKKSAYGKGKDGLYHVCLELYTPPRFERQLRYRHFSGDFKKDRKYRERLTDLGQEHAQIAHYAWQLRFILSESRGRQDLWTMCEEAGIHPPQKADIPAEYGGFFTKEELELSRQWIRSFEWPVRLQLEALLRNGLANTGDIFLIHKHVERLVQERPALAADFLRRFSEKVKCRESGVSVLQCFEDALEAEERDDDRLAESGSDSYRSRGFVQCAHAIVTPTRILLEGPYDTQSNRIVRRYFKYRDHFVRVEFREEDGLLFHWPADVNGKALIEKRFGDILKKGFEIAGRHFRFLGYSTSGLREHSAWFMSEFEHPVDGLVTVDGIRRDLGTFENCIRIPSKYAARIALAFSGTHPSVKITRDQWDDRLEDLGEEPYQHTDGQGVISKGLRDKIWDVLTAAWPDKRNLVLKPSAFLIRFLGFKGVVVVDEHLEGIYMRLRPSMRKFSATEKDEQEAEIEIAKAFSHPQTARTCRPLVAVLEDLGIHKQRFIKLQEEAKKDTITAGDTITGMAELFRAHDLGNVFGLQRTLQRLEKAGVGTVKEKPEKAKYTLDNDFIKCLLKSAQTHILREFKHEARIPIKDAHQLVGVVDEGPAWLEDGIKDVFCLEEGQIFVCVQAPDSDKPVWIEGHVSISRSPHIHPGDVQRVWAIGAPPDDVPCFFRNLRNVVVMPSVGKRSLASMLAGGDVDGDEFLVIKDPSLLPTEFHEAANYEGTKPIKLDRDSTIDDICDFYVEYMQSDVMGLVADTHLLIADQSKAGVLDPDCMKLAQLCSQAVDYPKNGVPVNIDDLPRPYIRAKPDWKKKEDKDARPGDYYESDRALGELFRNINVGTFEAPPSSYPNGAPLTPIWEEPLSDNISKALTRDVKRYLHYVENEEADIAEIELLFRYYARELAYICLTHAPSENTDVRLSEEEVSLGVILAQCSQRRWKKGRMHRMREHVGQLVKDVKENRRRGLGVPSKREKSEEPNREDIMLALAKGWVAWDFGMRNRGTFGARSFALIGLGVVCGMLEMLEKLDTRAKAAKSGSASE